LRPPRHRTAEEIRQEREEAIARARGWGSVARRGATSIRAAGPSKAPTGNVAVPEPIAQWEEEPTAPRVARSEAVPPRAPYQLPADVAAEVRRAFTGTAHARERAVTQLSKAAEAYDRHRFEEALRLARGVADIVPDVAAVRELAGLAAYRAQRWPLAKAHLRAHFALTEDPEHLPLVMDADRALGKPRLVERDFADLVAHEPSPEVLAEARIVMASTWADQGRYTEAIELLQRGGAAKALRNPAYRHVRLWYALGDVLDRAGDVAGARELFVRVVAADPEAYDAAARLAELGPTAPRKNRPKRTAPTSTKREPRP
jgi:tetratricopeptide (TPR) repeat protein